LNVPVTGGRTIAADPTVYPPGALAFIKARKPVVSGGKLLGWTPFSRFVLSQDAGKAIQGAGRIDIFCGGTSEAEEVAGRLKETGELYFLIKKCDFGCGLITFYLIVVSPCVSAAAK
jgi:membrane-bound lytic murein transglycosylase A